jgi:hypothetical protein
MIQPLPQLPDSFDIRWHESHTGKQGLASVVASYTIEKHFAGISVAVDAVRRMQRDKTNFGLSPPRKRQRKPTLVSVAKQASKAALEVARYEIKPDGTIVVVPGRSESTEASNPWLDDLKVTKQ